MVAHRFSHRRQLSSIVILLDPLALRYHCKESFLKGILVVAIPHAYHVGFNSGYNLVPAVIFADSSWYNKAKSVAEIPNTSWMPGKVGIPFEIMGWTWLRKYLKLLKTRLHEIMSSEDILVIWMTETLLFMNVKTPTKNQKTRTWSSSKQWI